MEFGLKSLMLSEGWGFECRSRWGWVLGAAWRLPGRGGTAAFGVFLHTAWSLPAGSGQRASASAISVLADAHFARLLSERSGGRIRMATHFGGALGYESRDHFEAVETGALDLASSPLDKLVGFAPIFQLQSLPFLTPGQREARALYEVARPYYEAAFREVGQTLLYASPLTPIGIWAKRRLEHPAQLAGLKIRTFDRNGAATLKTAGAAPVQLAWSDVVPALSTNLIEAVLTSDEGGVAGKFWEHMEYFHDLGYGVGVSVVHMNSRVLDGLPADLQAIVRETAAEVETAAWERARLRRGAQSLGPGEARCFGDHRGRAAGRSTDARRVAAAR